MAQATGGVQETTGIGRVGMLKSEWQPFARAIRAVTLQAALKYGSAGGELVVRVQTSLDGGKMPIDIALFRFERKSQVWVANVSKNGCRLPFEPAPLKSGIMDGILGDRLRFVIEVTGAGYKDSELRLHYAVDDGA